ncbi:MAG: spore germination protein GerW family protein [Dehalococcoidia bacterium]|nr:spore germination protein GerW family protein [Dehalococcoidia bacterium]
MGFGFGGFGSKGRDKAEGGGTGIGGGGGVKSVAVIIINKHGIKVELTGGTIVPVAERVIDLINHFIDKRFAREEGK